MALLDDLTKKAAKFTETAIDKTGEFAEEAKLKLRITNLQADQDDLYRELGQYFYNLIQDENSVDAVVADLRQRIDDLDEQITNIKSQLEKGK